MFAICRILVIVFVFISIVSLEEIETRWGISSGTTWCGFGNISKSADVAEGYYRSIDHCCRLHDHCNDTISAFTTKYGYFNFRPWTISECECDEEFRICLKSSYSHGETAVRQKAKRVGKMFFDNSNNACFHHEYRKVCKVWQPFSECSAGYVIERYIKIYELAIFEC